MDGRSNVEPCEPKTEPMLDECRWLLDGKAESCSQRRLQWCLSRRFRMNRTRRVEAAASKDESALAESCFDVVVAYLGQLCFSTALLLVTDGVVDGGGSCVRRDHGVRSLLDGQPVPRGKDERQRRRGGKSGCPLALLSMNQHLNQRRSKTPAHSPPPLRHQAIPNPARNRIRWFRPMPRLGCNEPHGRSSLLCSA